MTGWMSGVPRFVHVGLMMAVLFLVNFEGGQINEDVLLTYHQTLFTLRQLT